MIGDALPPVAPQGEVIIVTGRALPDPASERAYRVEIIGHDDLKDSPTQDLDQVLRQVAGLQYFRRSGADSAHPTSQGVTLRALGGNASSRAILVLDGVPQADPFGGWVNWPAYDPEGLEEIRVIRGGGSVRYGQGALAGAIDMRSLSDRRLSGSLEAGSRSSLSGRLNSGISAGDGLVTINVQGSRSSGFVPVTRDTRGPADQPAPWREASLRTRMIAPLAEEIEVQAGALAFVEERERGVAFTGNRTRGADASLRFVGTGSWQWSMLGYAQWRNMRSSFARIDNDRSAASRVALQDVPSRGLGASAEIRPPLGPVDLRLGFDVRRVDGQSREFATYVDGEPTRRRFAGGSSATQGLFAEATFGIGELELSGGARIDHWRVWSGELVERPIIAGPFIVEERYRPRSGWEPIARLGATLGLSDEAKLRVATYRGWRLPTLNELFRPFRAGADATAANAALDPERLSGAELGFDYEKNSLGFGLTAFANRLSGAISNVTLGQGPGTFPGVGFVAGSFRQRHNVDAVKVAGLETSAALKHGPWSARFGASLNRARVEADGAAAAIDGLRPAQTPAFSLSASIGWEDRGRGFKLMVHHSGAQYEDDLNRLRLAPATTVNVFARWPLSSRLELIGRGVNLLDERVIAGIDDDGAIERASPRSLWLGIRLRAD